MLKNNQGFIIGKLLSLVLITIAFMFGLVYARHAHEGEALYPMRILGETIEYSLIPSEEGKISFRIDQLNDLGFEIRKALQKGDQEQAAQKSETLNKKSQELKERIDNLAKEGNDTTELNQSLKSIADSQLCIQAQTDKL